MNRRPRKGAWIEICLTSITPLSASVAPARGRGLKFLFLWVGLDQLLSPPQGGVD